jgi:alpha-mannosidase
VGNELAVYEEYPAHPTAGEGPWHLLPKGPVVCSSEAPAEVRAYRSPLGQRLVLRGRVGTLLCYTQTLTLWRRIARVDCRTTIDDFTDADRLLRLRWPCPVPGAMPVSEVGDAVVGRGFALLHEASDDGVAARSVDTANHPWTLDNPAYSWFGLSSAVRIRIGDDVRAVSVAEVIAPTQPMSGLLARDLMVALVRAGVTATCSSAEKPRYGHLGVDSNLPDARIALGGPGQNAFTKAVLAAADPVYTVEVDRQLAATGRARVWVPAAAPLPARWVPDADLRGSRALPVLVIASRDDADLGSAITSVVDDLVDAEVVVDQQAPTGLQRFEPHTVAVLNRGVPSFAVEADGTLHTALMRSCTGWPSGVWIDEPRRTAPDGSNFQLQHWTHVFDYALVSGGGDWRRAAIPARSAEFSHPLLAVPASGRARGLPATGSLLQVEPADSVQLGALKAAGNPLAHGSAQPVDASRVAIRLVETHGRDADIVVRSPLGTVSELHPADLLERPRLGPRGRELAALHGYQICTALARLDMPRLFDASDDADTALAPQAENCQPLYARYWLHNRGPAPLGGLPAVAHLHPHRVTAVAGTDVVLHLTASSDCSDSPLTGAVALVCPPGWSAGPAELPFTLRPGEYLAADVAVTVPPGAGSGLYPVRAQLRVTGDDIPPAWCQMVEDVCLVSVGVSMDEVVSGASEGAVSHADDGGLLYLTGGPADVEVTAGDSARLTVTVSTDACADLSLEAHLISPWGTWEWIGPAARGAVLPARGSVGLGFDVAPPSWVEPGEWWALVRVGCAGRLVYSPAAKVTVR